MRCICLVMSAVGCSRDFTWGEGRSKKEGGTSAWIMPLQLQVAFHLHCQREIVVGSLVSVKVSLNL